MSFAEAVAPPDVSPPEDAVVSVVALPWVVSAVDVPLSLEPQPANRLAAIDSARTGAKMCLSFFVILSHLIILFAWPQTRCIMT